MDAFVAWRRPGCRAVIAGPAGALPPTVRQVFRQRVTLFLRRAAPNVPPLDGQYCTAARARVLRQSPQPP